MPKARVKGPDHDVNMQVGIMLGCEWPLSEIAKQLGVSVAAVAQRKKRRESRQMIEKAQGFTRLAVAKYVQTRIHEAEDEIAQRKKSIMSKGYRTIEKTLDNALSEENAEISPTHLKAAEMGIERTEGKPLDRKAILGLTGEDLRGQRQVDGDDLDNILAEVARINELRKKSYPALPAFTEGELVE